MASELRIAFIIIFFCAVSLNSVTNGSRSASGFGSGFKKNKFFQKFQPAPPKEDEIQDIVNPIKSIMILNKNGLPGQRRDKTINSNMSEVYAYRICKHVVNCVPGKWLRNFKFAEAAQIPTKMNENSIPVTTLRPGLKCYYGYGDHDYVLVIDSPKKSFYYVFDPEDEFGWFLKIRACLMINVKKKDLENKIEETACDQMADRMFGNSGTISSTKNNHVCNTIPSNGLQICCEAVIYDSRYKNQFMWDIRCETQITITRLIKENWYQSEFKTKPTEKFDAIRCSYTEDKHGGGKRKSFLVFNASEKNFYYMANQHPEFGWLIKSCFQYPHNKKPSSS